jgi:release factor glutamine methyltransferase
VAPAASSLRDAVREAVAQLTAAGVPSPEQDAVALAAHAMGSDPGNVRKAMALGAPAPPAYDSLVSQRAARVPLQHLTGRSGFRRLELRVGPGVFVPRPETEFVAGLAIDLARAVPGGHPLVVDLCTGSGAIALAVKDEVPGAHVYAVELGEDAHAWAVLNVERTGLDVRLEHGDATSAFPELCGRVDVVVSNPPYIPADAVPVDPEVRDHDPELALYGGSEDGLAIPLAVARRAADLLRPGGVLVMEHADSQGEALPTALGRSGHWSEIADRCDLADRPRATVAVRAPSPTRPA